MRRRAGVLKGEGACSEGKGGSSKARGVLEGMREGPQGERRVFGGGGRGRADPSSPESLLAEEGVSRRPRYEGQEGRRVLLRADNRPRGLPPLPLRAAT